MRRRLARFGVAIAPLLLCAAPAWAGGFDGSGSYIPASDAVVSVDFGADFDPVADRFVPDDAEAACQAPAFQVVTGEPGQPEGALYGDRFVRVDANINDSCAERFLFTLPEAKGSYVARAWSRHGGTDLQINVAYPDGVKDLVLAKMGPTGRVTSDGWVELESNAFPVDGAVAEAAYLRVVNFDSAGTDIDALELVPSGEYWEGQACSGMTDSVCGPDAVCIHQSCRLGRLYVPPLPTSALRNDVVDMFQSLLKVHFGGRKTRLEDLPESLAILDTIRYADDAWTFWSGWAHSVRRLHDWHTRAGGTIQVINRARRLNVCFFEGDGDLSQAVWPTDSRYKDLLVSHAGIADAHGLKRGDRLVSVDGIHPFEWALSIRAHDWRFWEANDADVYSELAERMRSMIMTYATSYTVVHCDADEGTCDAAPVTYAVADLPLASNGGGVSCDNRPFYHFKDGSGPHDNHGVGWSFFRGPIAETSDEEAIYGMVWDTLYGGGDPNGHVNGNLTSAFDNFKENARGVILDHRAGSGGTLDGAETATHLIRPPEAVLVFASPIEFGGFDGPATPSEGVELFNQLSASTMIAGSNSYDPDMPVALLLHRDGSASDFMPFAFKGAPNTRIFASQPTAGAFSTYYNLNYWGGISVQLASGDSISKDGEPLIGHGVAPDVVVVQKQSDLLAGRDTIHEAALQWVRDNLKEVEQ